MTQSRKTDLPSSDNSGKNAHILMAEEYSFLFIFVPNYSLIFEMEG